MLDKSRDFAAKLQDTIGGALPGDVTVRAHLFQDTGRIRVSAVDESDPERPAEMPLLVDGKVLAYWTFYMFTDSSVEGHLKINQMRMAMRPAHEDAPIVRLEFESRNTKAPVSHWQFHAERGALSFILSRTRAKGRYADLPVSLSALHFSAGGRRFRPGVEDFIQFLIDDCGFQSVPGWKQSIEDGREYARRLQVRTIARDFPMEVAQILRDNCWKVEPPDDFDGWEATHLLREF